jgi:hypothetical protein
MIELLIGLITGSVVTYLFKPNIKETVKIETDRSGGENWSLYIESTEDQNKYRGVYDTPTGRRYEYVGNGITETLGGLRKKIEL